MKLEVLQGHRREFSHDFQVEAVKLITVRWVTVAQASRDFDVLECVLWTWIRELAQDAEHAFSRAKG